MVGSHSTIAMTEVPQVPWRPAGPSEQRSGDCVELPVEAVGDLHDRHDDLPPPRLTQALQKMIDDVRPCHRALGELGDLGRRTRA